MAKTVQSRKAKGRNFQKEIVQEILTFFPELEPDDVQWRSMGASGEDIMLSPKARKIFPVSIEAKCQETLNFWQAYEQSKTNAKAFIPVLMARRNRTEPLAVLSMANFMWLMSKVKYDG